MRGAKNARLVMSHLNRSLPFSSPLSPLAAPHSAASPLRPSSAAMSSSADPIPQQKRALRTQVRKALKALSLDQRSLEDTIIQNFVLESSWFKSTTSLCAYISCDALREVDTSRILSEILSNSETDYHTQAKKKLYVPRVEDKNSNMRMFSISSIEDLVANSMNILEPSPTYADGTPREDVMLASHPIDIFLLPGLAFDKSGCRLGRGGGYYDVFLKNYQELAMERGWKQPLRVALAYSAQIMDDNVIPVSQNDVLVDALVSISGVIPISSAALEQM